MQYILLLFLPFLLFAKPFKVATYNVENLFDAQYAGTEYGQYQKKHNWTERMVDIKLNHVAEVICDLDADVLGLQEIENTNIFGQLKQRLAQVGCRYEYGAITSKKDATIQVAILSKFPIQKQNELVVSTSPRVRNILDVELIVEGNPLVIYVNHWKSRAYKGFESKRIKYANRLKKRLDGLPKSTDYILLGDFNTEYDAHLSLEKKIDDTQGKTGLHDVLHIAKERSLVSELDMSKNLSGYHSTLWKELDLKQRWNTKFYGQKGTPDHIVLPSSMYDKKGIDYVNNSFKVFKKSYLFTRRGYINRWQYKKGKHRGKGYSDHLPVYAYFDTKPYDIGTDRVSIPINQGAENIEYLYTKEHLENEIILKDTIVIWKHRRNAIIKQSAEGRGILLFGCAGELEVGTKYDLLVRAIKTYKGLKEVTHAHVLEEQEKVSISAYFLKQEDLEKNMYRQNEVIKNIIGVYRKKHLYIEGLKIPIYFKNKKSTPPNGSNLKIHLALLGYYKRLQLVISNKNDFEILEK